MNSLITHRIFQVLRLLFVLLIVIAFLISIRYLTPLLYPFLIGFIIAYLINKPVTRMEKKWKVPRWLAVSLVLLVFIGFLLTVSTILIAKMIVEISDLIAQIPTSIEKLTNYFHQFLTEDIYFNIYWKMTQFYENLDLEYQEKIKDTIGVAVGKVAAVTTVLTREMLEGIKNILSSIPGAATVLVISVLAAFFISKDYDLWKEKMGKIIPERVYSKTKDIAKDLQTAFFGFIKAQLTLISITSVIVIVGLLILRVKYAVTIGLIAGLVDLLPYLGTGAIFIPWIIYLFFEGNYHLVIGLSILYGIIVVQRQIMEPKIVAENIGLDPLLTLVALFVGLQWFGFLGLIIGPVTLVIINALIKTGVFTEIWNYIKGHAPTT